LPKSEGVLVKKAGPDVVCRSEDNKMKGLVRLRAGEKEPDGADRAEEGSKNAQGRREKGGYRYEPDLALRQKKKRKKKRNKRCSPVLTASIARVGRQRKISD